MACRQSRQRLGGIFCAGVAFFLLGSVAPVRGLDPNREITQYRVKTWGQEQGMPQNHVQPILQTRDGYLWLGTQEGLVRFDGVGFTIYDRSNTPELPSNWVVALCEDAAGRLWVGTVGGLMGFTPGGSGGPPAVYTTAQGLSVNAVLSLCATHAGDLWIGTFRGGLNRWRDGRIVPGPDAVRALAGERISSLCEDRAGRLWIGSDSGVYCLEGEKLTRYTTAEGLPNNGSTMTISPDGTLWAGTRAGLARFQDGRFVAVAAEALGGKGIGTLLGDRDGNLWLGMQDGLRRLCAANGEVSTLTTKDGLGDNFMDCLCEDREGNLWLGSSAGNSALTRLSDTKFACYGATEGLADESVKTVCYDAGGTLWVGTRGELYQGREGKFRPLSAACSAELAGRPAPTNITATYGDRLGRLWFAATDGVLRCLQAGQPLEDRFLSKDKSVFGRAITEDGAGQLWVGTNQGVRVFRDGTQVAAYTAAADGLTSDFIYTVLPGHDGSVWLSTKGGVDRFKDGVWTHWGAREGVGGDSAFCLHEDEAGAIWIGTGGGGLLRLKDGALSKNHAACTARDGLPSDTSYQILEEGTDLWLSSSRGVTRVRKADLDAFFDGTLSRVTATVYGVADGMRTAECNGGSSPPGCRGSDGRLWFPTARGVVSVRPREIVRNTVIPPVTISRLVIDQTTNKDDAAIDGTVLAPGIRRLEFRYAGLSFTAPERVRFRYRLTGIDRDWVDAGARREAFYNNLPPGAYRFVVQACNNDGLWNDRGTAVGFSLQPYFYQTGWFKALVALTVLGAGAGLFWWRQRQLQERFAVVLAERTRIARELHDTCAQALFAVGFELNSAADELSGEHPARLRLDSARSVVDQGLHDARALIASLRGRGVREATAVDLRGSLAAFIQTVNTAALDFSLEVDGNAAALLSEAARHELLRTCQEAIHNALKHADASRISVEVGFNAARPGWVAATVRDDGRGFAVATAAPAGSRTDGGEGLGGMRERAAQVGGTLEVTSAPGEGTVVRLNVPFRI